MAKKTDEELERELRKAVDQAVKTFSESEVRKIVESELNAKRSLSG